MDKQKALVAQALVAIGGLFILGAIIVGNTFYGTQEVNGELFENPAPLWVGYSFMFGLMLCIMGIFGYLRATRTS